MTTQQQQKSVRFDAALVPGKGPHSSVICLTEHFPDGTYAYGPALKVPKVTGNADSDARAAQELAAQVANWREHGSIIPVVR